MPIRKNAIVLFANADLTKVRVTEVQKRYPEKLNTYLEILQENPDDHLGLLLLKPTKDGYFELLDGHHRYFAYMLMGRRVALTVIVDERYIDDPRREDPGFVQGVCAELAAQAGDDARSASLGDLRAQEGRRPAQVTNEGLITDLINLWRTMPEAWRLRVADASERLSDDLDALLKVNNFKKEDH